MLVIGVVVLILVLLVAILSVFGRKLKVEEEKQDNKECRYNVKK